MRIFIELLNGARHIIDIDEDATVGLLKEKLEEQTGISVEDQKLVWGGKYLLGVWKFKDINLVTGATIHLIERQEPSSDRAQASPEARIEAWKSKARQGDFDDDIYIVDPQAHYSKLDSLEKRVVKASELFRRRGFYSLYDISLPEGLLEYKAIDDEIWDSLDLSNLGKSYLMLCRILDSFDYLSASGFCRDFYSLLVENQETGLAEIVRIPRSLINEVKRGIEDAVFRSLARESRLSLLLDCVAVPCNTFLQRLGVPLPSLSSLLSASIQELCRITAALLDLALVSYVGSHGSRFDLDYIGIDHEIFAVYGDVTFSFKCTLRPLACLDGFLDRRKVWVFQFDTKRNSQNFTSSKRSGRLSILAHMEDFADLWGPVWPVPARDSPDLIRRYNVSKGVICRVSKERTAVKNAVRCHWYDWASFQRRRIPKLFSPSEDLYLSKDDLLLIGTRIRENEECGYTLDDFERSYGNPMGDLGTRPSSWNLETRGLAISLSKLVGIQVQGTQKKIPETTLKQHISDKWRSNPTRANPGVLNQMLGIEISHCTGNARRVTMKRLLLMKTVRPLLERAIPGWTSTTWGSAFLKALCSNDNEALFDVWTKHSQDRAQMAELVCCVLDLLDTTGTRDDVFTVAFLNDNREHSVELILRNNDWANLLQDSRLTAAYAVINKVCLECETYQHTTAICGGRHAYTVLQTEVATLDKIELQRLEFQPSGQIFKEVYKDHLDTILMTPEDSLSSGISAVGRTLHFSSLATGYEVRDKAACHGFRTCVFLRASKQSYGGMKNRRQRAVSVTPQREPHPLNNRHVESQSKRRRDVWRLWAVRLKGILDLSTAGGEEPQGSPDTATRNTQAVRYPP